MTRDLGCQAPRRQKQRNCSRNYRESEGASHSQTTDPTELDNDIDKVHRLPLTNKLRQTEKHHHQTLYISSKLIAIEKNFSPREMSYTIIATRKSIPCQPDKT